jgi:protein gp37
MGAGMSESSIEWTDATWNPTVGCTKVSAGCKHCYALTMHRRLTLMGSPKYAEPFEVVKPHPEHLAVPLSWRKPRKVFVNSMSDLFHADVPNEYIAAVFGVMAATPQHTYQVLTKRAERLPEWFRWYEGTSGAGASANAAVFAASDIIDSGEEEVIGDIPDAWPLPNIWLGVSVENQEAADERIPHLLSVPAAVRFVSYEPALGPVDFDPFLYAPTRCRECGSTAAYYDNNPDNLPPFPARPVCLMGATNTGEPGASRCVKCDSRDLDELPSLSWVIVGGESGPGARPFDVAWARSTVAQCKAAGVPVFVKQLGAGASLHTALGRGRHVIDGEERFIIRDPKGGDMQEWPEDLRVREFPREAGVEVAEVGE